MIRSLLKRLGRVAPAVLAPAALALLPEVLELEPGCDVRVVLPKVEDGYAAVVNSAQGFFIINHYDLGVGWSLRTLNAYETEQGRVLQRLASSIPAGGVLLDVGANIGVFTVLLARAAGPAATVHAFEAQRVLFHMLAGNMALNSIENAHCHCTAVGEIVGSARLPRLNYRSEAGFGSVELNREHQSDLGQQARDGQFDEVPMTSIDGMEFARVDMMKIDVEGMEAEVLAGAVLTLRAHRPLLYIEHLKSDKIALWHTLRELRYDMYDVPENFICVPAGDERAAYVAENMAPWSPA